MLPVDILISQRLAELPLKGENGLIQNPDKWIRDSEKQCRALYDAISSFKGDHRIEIKTQKDLQWFDIGKFYQLSAEDSAIEIVFLMHSGQETIDTIWNIKLGDLLKLAISDPDYAQSGWTLDAIKRASQLKNDHPKLQLKAPLYVRSFHKRYLDMFQILWTRE